MSAALPVVQSLFAQASAGATGIFRIHHLGLSTRGGTVSRLELEQGYVHAMSNLGDVRGPLGEDALVTLLGRLPATAEPAFEPRAPRSPLLGQRVAAFHPARALRRHVEAALPPTAPPSDEARVELRFRPHSSCISGVESNVVALLAGPRRYGELVAASARPIVERLIGFLVAAGSVGLEDPTQDEAWATLGLSAGATSDEIKSAWRRLARELHPDLRPGEDEAAAAERVARFHHVSAAYKRLLPGG